MQRLFLSIPLSNQVKNQIAPEIERFKKSISDWEITWVAPENLHITLVFFGWVKKEQIEILKTEIGRAVSDFPSFKITTGKVSAKRWPIWLEIEQGREELNRLAEELVHQLTIKGSLEEGRGFYPHLTLGRVKKRGKTRLPLVNEEFSWKVERLVLYESTYKGEKRVYTETASFTF